jgi:eukaryotic-like serine/threonine-protein kinase
VGRYRIAQEIGRGGMGVVYEARDEALGRRVALKLLPETAAEPELASHLLSEARAAAGLSHPNVVSIYEVGVHETGPFLAMEYVDGVTARDWLETEPRSWREVVRVFSQAGQGLAAAHDAGIVHGDIKPSNILVGDDRTRVADFGLARSASLPEPGGELAIGSPLGTPRYMAPEHRDGLPADERTDQYSFCASLHEALYGVPPGESSERSLWVPAWLRRAVLRGTSADPAARHPSMQALVDELARPRGRARWLTVGLGGSVAAGAAAFYLLAGTAASTPCEGAQRRLVGLWDEAVKARMAADFSADDASFAPATFKQVARALDDYADQWKQMHREACEATRVHGEQSDELLDRRMACLDHRLSSLDRFAGSLTGADAETLARAPDAARALPAIDECGDRSALASGWVGTESAERAQIREAITAAVLRYAVGANEEALRLGEQAAQAASHVGEAALEAEARLIVGRVHVETRATGAGVESLSRAADLAGNAGADKVQIHAWIVLSEAYQILGRMAEARRVLDLADAALGERPDRELEVHALLGRGALAGRSGEFEEARRRFEQALRIQTSIGGPDAEQLANLHIPLATALRRLGRLDEALVHVDRAVAVTLPLGEDHPRVAHARSQRGIVLRALGRHAEALDEYQLAAASVRRAYGEESALLSGIENSIGTVLSQMGRASESVEHFHTSLAIKQALDEEMAKTLQVRSNLLNALMLIGEASEAEPRARDLLADRQELLGARHPDVGISRRVLGDVLADLGRLDEASSEHELGLEILEQALGDQHVQVARTLQSMAELQRAHKRFAAARRLDERAIAILGASLPADHPERFEADLRMADNHMALGAPRKARELAERALAFFETRDDPKLLGRARWTLAQTLWPNRRERDRAIELARAAREDLQRAGAAPMLANVEAWLDAHAPAASGE